MEKEKTIQEQTNESWEQCKKEIDKQIKVLMGKDCKKADEMRETITQEPLEIKTRTHFSGDKEYMILLGTGGPAMRIFGGLDEYDEPYTAEYQFQNWFTEWTTAPESVNDENLIEYARCFYFGE